MRTKLKWTLLVIGACLAITTSVRAGASDLSGFWQLQSNNASSKPELTPWATAQKAKLHLSGEAIKEDLDWCVFQGIPFAMDQAGPLDIIVAPREIVITAEKLALQRHLYTDNQKSPDPKIFDETPVGNTHAHWDGDVLKAETWGLTDGVGPAGIPRTRTSKLQEEFRLSGDSLTVISTWTDPKALHRPYTYTLVYKRLPADSAATENYCDPRKNGVGNHALDAYH